MAGGLGSRSGEVNLMSFSQKVFGNGPHHASLNITSRNCRGSKTPLSGIRSRRGILTCCQSVESHT